MRFDKESTLARAKKLIEIGGDEELRYACLELRMCIEAISYDKLKVYAKRVSPELLDSRNWQPRKIVTMLTEFEPYAEQDFTFVVRAEGADGKLTGNAIVLGHHKAIKLKFIKETYDRLGSRLHMPTLAQQEEKKEVSAEKLRKELSEIISELEVLCSSSVDSSLATVINFKCEMCGNFIVRNKKGLEKKKLLICPEPTCKAEYEFFYNDEKPMFKLIQLEFQCPNCSLNQYLDKHKIREGTKVTCGDCSSKFILTRQWVLSRYEDAE